MRVTKAVEYTFLACQAMCIGVDGMFAQVDRGATKSYPPGF